MRDLFLSECRRYLHATLIFTALHILIQLFLSRLDNMLTQGWHIQVTALAVFYLAGLGFALHQVGSYRQPGRWIWLMHRPLSGGAIFAALTLASTTMICVAVGLPLLLMVAGTDLFSDRTVDLRHYVMVPYVIIMTVIAWLSGAAILLGSSRFAALIMVLPYLMLMHESTAASLLLMALLCAALMAYIVYTSFKPNRATPPAAAHAVAAKALPLLLGCYLLLLWGGLGVGQIGALAWGVHPSSMAVPPVGSYAEASRADGRSLMLTGLLDATDARTAHWRRQLPLLEVYTLTPNVAEFALRQQLSNKNTPNGKLPEQNELLQFNHDSMRFDAFDSRSGTLKDSLGPGGNAFPDIPLLLGEVVLPHGVMSFDSKTRRFSPLVTLGNDELLAASPRKTPRSVYLLTNSRMIAYAAPPDTAYQERYSLALTGPLSNLARVDVAELLDGTLVSLTGGRAQSAGASGSRQTVFFVDLNGNAQTIAARPIGHDFPLLFEHAGWWLSPALHAVTALPEAILPSGAVTDQPGALTWNLHRPAGVYAAAVLSSVLAVAGTWLWRLRSQYGASIGVGWLAASAALGLPCLAALIIMYPQRPRAAQTARTQAQSAVSAPC